MKKLVLLAGVLLVLEPTEPSDRRTRKRSQSLRAISHCLPARPLCLRPSQDRCGATSALGQSQTAKSCPNNHRPTNNLTSRSRKDRRRSTRKMGSGESEAKKAVV